MKYKKKIIILLSIVTIVFVLYKLYEMWQYSNDRANFSKLTGISKFDVISDVGDNHYFYIIATVSAKDKQKMLSMHYYISTPVNLKGNVQYSLKNVNENNYLYYLEDSGHGYLGYVIYFISKIDNTVILYVSYSD